MRVSIPATITYPGGSLMTPFSATPKQLPPTETDCTVTLDLGPDVLALLASAGTGTPAVTKASALAEATVPELLAALSAATAK